jgi:hypothetical protein
LSPENQNRSQKTLIGVGVLVQIAFSVSFKKNKISAFLENYLEKVRTAQASKFDEVKS